ncbi:MAG: hypothetical protein JW912_01835 [Sedimentisphaerales bacterium]|nr:hypothetical protein [Sedimentisphaerales bacterium]
MAKKQAGTYYGVLVQAGVDTLNSEKKTPFMYLTFRMTHFLEGGDWVGIDEPFERDVKYYLSDSAWSYTEKDLERLEFNGNFEEPEFKKEFYNPGTEVLCSVRREGDKSYEDWDLPGGVNGPRERTAPSKEVLQKFKARWNTNQSAKQPPSALPKVPAEAPSVPSVDEDDIPF